MRTPFSKRLPVATAIAIALFIVLVLGHGISFWEWMLIYCGLLVLFALVLRYIFGLPWSRIIRYREPK
ncbi:MAG: hypothetical protein WAL63_02465 [Solirubrobacteraceae bacterium]